MGKILAPLKALFRDHKLKMFFVLLFALAFFVVCFPNEDLSDWVTAQIFRANANMYVQMDDLHLELLPFGVGAKNLVFETKGQPAIKAGAVMVSPLISKLITFKPGVELDVDKLFGGTVDLEYGQGDKAKSGVPFDEITLHADHLSLDELSGFLRTANLSSFKLQGVAKADIPKLKIDHAFGDQPSGVFSFDVHSFTIPSQTFMFNFNGVQVPQALPTLELGRLNLQNAKLDGGVLDIPELQIGEQKGEFYGKIRGSMGFQLKKVGDNVFPEVSNMNLNLKIVADKGFMDRTQKVLGGFLMLMPAKCRQDTAKGTEINCTMKLAKAGDPPTFEPSNEKM